MPRPDAVLVERATRELLQQSVKCVDHVILERSETARILQRSRETIARSRCLIAVLNGRYPIE